MLCDVLKLRPSVYHTNAHVGALRFERLFSCICMGCRKPQNITNERRSFLSQTPKENTMSFIFKCPYCNQILEAKDEWIGQQTDCPACGKTITIQKSGKKQEEQKLLVGCLGGNVNIEHNTYSPTEDENRHENAVKNKTAQENDNSYSLTSDIILLLLAAGIVWLTVLYLKHYPRVSFWTIAPIAGFIILAYYEQIHKFITMMLCAGIILWGWEVHHLNASSSSYSRTTSYSDSNYRSEQYSESKISVTVTVTKWFVGPYDSWKYNCEFKLYADNECVATRNSTSMSVSFNIKVKKGAELRAEMLTKNGFGGIAETLEGPASWEEKITASYSGQNIKIES